MTACMEHLNSPVRNAVCDDRIGCVYHLPVSPILAGSGSLECDPANNQLHTLQSMCPCVFPIAVVWRATKVHHRPSLIKVCKCQFVSTKGGCLLGNNTRAGDHQSTGKLGTNATNRQYNCFVWCTEEQSSSAGTAFGICATSCLNAKEGLGNTA